MDNYRVASRRGFEILSPSNRTSPFGFNLQVYLSVPEMETLILASHDSDINVGICGTQEGSPKNERCLHVFLHIKYYKVYRNKKFWIFIGIFSAIPAG
jgi:hypothetical protein